MRERIAECINILGEFCGKRDLPALTREELQKKYGISQADMMVLFGGSILCGSDVLAEAMKNHVAGKYLIVGGEGHTTESLRRKAHKEFPEIETDGMSEAEVFQACLKARYSLQADFLECKSTNCGNNITNLLELIRREGLSFRSVILVQDASMQHRMEAGLRKYAGDITIINFAAYRVRVVLKEGEPVWDQEIRGMWEMNRYISLLMGEIPRLSDEPQGYGPEGKNFIAHVEIPMEVKRAFWELKEEYADMVREANPLYASDRFAE